MLTHRSELSKCGATSHCGMASTEEWGRLDEHWRCASRQASYYKEAPWWSLLASAGAVIAKSRDRSGSAA